MKRIKEIRSSQDRHPVVISSYFHNDTNGAKESSKDFKTNLRLVMNKNYVSSNLKIRRIVYHVRMNAIVILKWLLQQSHFMRYS